MYTHSSLLARAFMLRDYEASSLLLLHTCIACRIRWNASGHAAPAIILDALRAIGNRLEAAARCTVPHCSRRHARLAQYVLKHICIMCTRRAHSCSSARSVLRHTTMQLKRAQLSIATLL